MRMLKSYGVALLLMLLIAGWLASGTLIQGGKGPGNGETAIVDAVDGGEGGPLRSLLTYFGLIADEEDSAVAEVAPKAEPDAALQSVRVRRLEAQAMTLTLPLRGRTKAEAVVSVRPETSGVVELVHVKRGDRVAPGDLMCTLDKGTRAARVAQAEASLAQAKAGLEQAVANLETNQALRERGVSPANTARSFEVALAAAESALQAATASLDEARAELARTDLRSGVSGVVKDPVANVGDLLGANAVCGTIAQMDTLLFVGSVAESKISVLRIGMPAGIQMVTGEAVVGKVTFISSTADAATRSFEIEISIDNYDGRLREGVTAIAEVKIDELPAHLLPQSALTLASSGTIGIQTVVDGVVKFEPVNILRDTTEGVWVAGLTPQVDVITVGQEYVVDGQAVAATYVDGGADRS